MEKQIQIYMTIIIDKKFSSVRGESLVKTLEKLSIAKIRDKLPWTFSVIA